MYYRVLETGGGYQAGEVLDLGDAEVVAQIERPEPVAPVKVKTPKRG
jgi:hypothetical protein